MKNFLKTLVIFAAFAGSNVYGMERKNECGNSDGFVDGYFLGFMVSELGNAIENMPNNDLERIVDEFRKVVRDGNFDRARELYPMIYPFLLTEQFKKVLKELDLEKVRKLLIEMKPYVIIDGKSLLQHLIEKTVEYENNLNGVLSTTDNVGATLFACLIGFIAHLAHVGGTEVNVSLTVGAVIAFLFYLIERPVLGALNQWGTSRDQLSEMIDIIREAMNEWLRTEQPLDAHTRQYIVGLLNQDPRPEVAAILMLDDYTDLVRLDIESENKEKEL